jgi:hypothetical protein
MSEGRKYLKFVKDEAPAKEVEPDSSVADEVKTGNGNIKVTLGKPVTTNRIRNPHEGIRVIDHGQSPNGGGGFLKDRFNR